MKQLLLSEIPIEELIEKIAERIIKDKSAKIAKREPKRFLSLTELCNEYGFAKPTVYSLTSKLEIPHIKQGKRLLFERSKVEEWLFKSRKKTKLEIKNEFEGNLKKEKGVNYDK